MEFSHFLLLGWYYFRFDEDCFFTILHDLVFGKKLISLSLSLGILYGSMLKGMKFPFFDGDDVLNITINMNLSTEHYKIHERMKSWKIFSRYVTVFLSNITKCSDVFVFNRSQNRIDIMRIFNFLWLICFRILKSEMAFYFSSKPCHQNMVFHIKALK